MFINCSFYDIESLDNLFTLAVMQDKPVPQVPNIDIYYLCDNEEKLFCEDHWQEKMLDRIYQRNLNFGGTVRFFNLKEERFVRQLCTEFGCSDARFMNDPAAPSNYPAEFRITCDTDPDYDPDIHPYFMGYNSYNYDTTMLAYYFMQTWDFMDQGSDDPNEEAIQHVFNFNPRVTAKAMRAFNNKLFEPWNKNQMPSVLARDSNDDTSYDATAWMIRKNMIMSGRHLDVARLNEKQSKVGLKRLLGMLGYQILESDKLDTGRDSIETPDQLYDLVAYNISDVVNLKNLFYHKQYQGQFELKKGLLHTYPELIYKKKPGKDCYEPDISPQTVRSDRLTIDCSSAQFSTKSLCPYGHLKDIETVSFMYPAQQKADAMGIKRVNVLDEARKFFFGLYPQQELRDQFDRIYNFYKSIEGKNFNDSKSYNEDWTFRQSDGKLYTALPPHKISEIGKANTCIPYFDKDGNPTSCFVLFGVGGIHGAEYNAALLQADREAWQASMDDMAEVQRQFPDPVELRKAKKVTMPDGRVLEYKVFLKSGLKIADSQYRDFASQEPQLFRANKKGSYELNKKYVFTSTCQANHEDFTSYYPNLLRQMMAFFNTGLGYDRYAEIFDQKQDYGFLMKPKNANLTPENAARYRHLRPQDRQDEPVISDGERESYRVLREGTKLILNSASGAADATFENNIRVNNQIISMRIIGQLFSWRIGQAQSYAGATIPSTNTDGLYSVMEATLNNAILERESRDIGVEIEPEPLYLISKDSNNRIEMDAASGKIFSASGGTLGCRSGPSPTKALAHPAIIDWALTEYLIVTALNYKNLSMDGPFDRTIGMNILLSAKQKFDPVQLLIMYQNIIASSSGSITYIYGMRDGSDEPIVLQNYNRMFIVKENTKGSMHLWAAAARAISPAMKRKRQAAGERPVAAPDPNAKKVLEANGESAKYPDKDVVTKRVTNIDPEWDILIDNRDLHGLPAEDLQFIADSLDMEKYLQLLDNAYTRNWMNHKPGVEYAESDEDDEEESAED